MIQGGERKGVCIILLQEEGIGGKRQVGERVTGQASNARYVQGWMGDRRGRGRGRVQDSAARKGERWEKAGV